jgi:hypothetical protein
VPRLSNGEGSEVRVHSSLDTKSHLTSNRYTVYVTYDKGSKKEIINALGGGNVSETTNQKITNIGTIAIAIGALVSAIVTSYITHVFNKKRDKHLKHLERIRSERNEQRESILVIEFLAKLEKLNEEE